MSAHPDQTVRPPRLFHVRWQFLTAFRSRNHPAAKKRLKDIASGTWAWFADEPGHELAWYKVIPTTDDV